MADARFVPTMHTVHVSLHKPKCTTPCSDRVDGCMREVIPLASARAGYSHTYIYFGSLHHHASLLDMNISSSPPACQHRRPPPACQHRRPPPACQHKRCARHWKRSMQLQPHLYIFSLSSSTECCSESSCGMQAADRVCREPWQALFTLSPRPA